MNMSSQKNWSKTSFYILCLLVLVGIVVFDPLTTLKAEEDVASLDNLFFPKNPGTDTPQTESVVISKNNKIIYEKSNEHMTADTPHILWSVSKSVSSLIAGIAVQKNLIHVNDSVCQIAPQYKGKIDCQMKYSDIMEWASGLNFLEVYEGNADRTQSSVGQMLYGDGKQDPVQFVLSHKQIYPPGKHVYYSSGDSALVMGLLKYRMPFAEYQAFPFKNLFEPLGITTATFETDAQGHAMSGTSMYMSARDLLKVGQFAMNDGVLSGRRLLPVGWMNYVTSSTANFTESVDDPLWTPCRQWWKPNLKAMGLNHIAGFPQDIYVARGHWGQYLVIIPSLKLIAVRLGLDQKKSLDEIALIKTIAHVGTAQ